MSKSTAFISHLYQPPCANLLYCRDNLPLHLTRDFLFLGALIANWGDISESIYLSTTVKDEEAKLELFFLNDKHQKIAPLSKNVFGDFLNNSEGRPISYQNVRRFFISRFFQYRLLIERDELRRSVRGLYDITNMQTVESEYKRHEELLDVLLQTVLVPPYDASSIDYSAQNSVAYCIIDGWISPEVKTYFGQGEIGINYLICPHCQGNLDYRLSVEQ